MVIINRVDRKHVCLRVLIATFGARDIETVVCVGNPVARYSFDVVFSRRFETEIRSRTVNIIISSILFAAESIYATVITFSIRVLHHALTCGSYTNMENIFSIFFFL